MLLPNVYTNDGLRINESHVPPHIKNYRIPKNNIGGEVRTKHKGEILYSKLGKRSSYSIRSKMIG